MPLPKIIVFGKDPAETKRLQGMLRASGSWDPESVDATADLIPLVLQVQPLVLLIASSRIEPGQQSLKVQLAHAIGPGRVLIILLTDGQPAAEQVQQQGAVGTLPVNQSEDVILEQFMALVHEGTLLTQLSHLHELGGEEFVVEMIDLFLDMTPKHIAEARQTQAQGDWTTARRAIHSVKSNAGNLGAKQLRDEAAELEDRAALEQGEDFHSLLDQLEQTFFQVEERLRRRKAEGP